MNSMVILWSGPLERHLCLKKIFLSQHLTLQPKTTWKHPTLFIPCFNLVFTHCPSCSWVFLLRPIRLSHGHLACVPLSPAGITSCFRTNVYVWFTFQHVNLHGVSVSSGNFQTHRRYYRRIWCCENLQPWWVSTFLQNTKKSGMNG